MKRFLIHISSFVISISFTFAQADFRPGFIITVENDTIFGEIDYRSNSKNYQACRFKKDNTIIEYNSRQLTGYGYTNDKHYTADVVDGAFVEVVVKGELSLYKYAAVYFLRKSGGKLYKLESKEIEVNIAGKVGLKKDTRWKGIILARCNENERLPGWPYAALFFRRMFL